MFETEELAREEVERVGSNQSIPVLELRGVRDRGAGQGGGGEGGIQQQWIGGGGGAHPSKWRQSQVII